MLSKVNYKDLGEDFFDPFTQTTLEYRAYENCYDFIGQLEEALIDANMIQLPEMIILHLCSYLGVTATALNYAKSRDLEPEIHNLLKRQAEFALSKFNYYLPRTKTDDKSSTLDKLKENTPGNIVNHTLRLGGVIQEMMRNLSDRHISFKEKQKDWVCPYNEFMDFLLPLVEAQHEEWREDLGHLSVNFAINQLTIQIGWLIGYFSYLDKKSDTSSYLEPGQRCISMYIEHINKLQESLLSQGKTLSCMELGEDEIDEKEDITSASEIDLLLNEIGDLSKKTHADLPPPTTKFQKDTAIFQAELDKLIIEFVLQGMETKIIYMSLFYFWLPDLPPTPGPGRFFSQDAPEERESSGVRRR
jgi:hypothetical protein